MYQVSGTKGFANKYPNQGYALQGEMLDESITPDHENLNAHAYVSPEVRSA